MRNQQGSPRTPTTRGVPTLRITTPPSSYLPSYAPTSNYTSPTNAQRRNSRRIWWKRIRSNIATIVLAIIIGSANIYLAQDLARIQINYVTLNDDSDIKEQPRLWEEEQKGYPREFQNLLPFHKRRHQPPQNEEYHHQHQQQQKHTPSYQQLKHNPKYQQHNYDQQQQQQQQPQQPTGDVLLHTHVRNKHTPPPAEVDDAPLVISNETARHLSQSLVLANQSTLQYLQDGYSLESNLSSHMDAFRSAKQASVGPFPHHQQPLEDIYQQCLDNFQPMAGYERYTDMDALEQRKVAEALFVRQEGKLWMQHARKAGGTTLCMLLRLNQHGLIRAKPNYWDMPHRETCQIARFCVDCDLTKALPHDIVYDHKYGGDNQWPVVPRLVDCITTTHFRNFYEVEGTVSPPTILTDPEWANFVFVSTLRHPIARIISSLHNDPPFTSISKGCYKPEASKQLNNCSKAILASTEDMETKCRQGIYYCYSNYYIRMFAGHRNGAYHPVTRETLDIAKQNFRRYSCVILQELWAETSQCLSHKLGLHLTSNEGYNVQGGMHQKMHEQAVADRSGSMHTFSESLTNTEYGRLLELNALDLEFYNWAKELILSGYFLK